MILILMLCLGGALEDLVTKKETALKKLAAHHEALYSSRCGVGKCPCSVPACGTRFDSANGFECTEGKIRGTESSVVRLPAGSDFDSAELRADICSSKEIESTFKSNKNTYGITAYQYVSHWTGTLRMFPGIPQERDNGKCSDYDPRIRPWYVTAASGPKDIILVLDVSGSMSRPHNSARGSMSRLQAVVNAAHEVLNTLTLNDYVGIVVFSNEAVPLVNTGSPLQATAENVKKLQDELGTIVAAGATYFLKGLRAAFDLFKSGHSNELTSKCSHSILFLTDGAATDSNILQGIAAMQAEVKPIFGSVKIFTYSMGTDADHVVPQQMSCDNEGVWAAIPDGDDPLTYMTNYYLYLAAGVHDTRPRWTTVYEDAFGLGSLVTVAIGAYDRSGSVPFLIGVAGIDVVLEDLTVLAGYQQVTSELISRSKVCPSASLSQCDLQILRKKVGQECPAPAVPLSQCAGELKQECGSFGFSFSDAMCQNLNPSTGLPSDSSESSKSYDDVVSCGETGGSAPKVVIPIVIVVLILAAVGGYFVMKRRGEKRREKERRASYNEGPMELAATPWVPEPTPSVPQPTPWVPAQAPPVPSAPPQPHSVPGWV
eukprot:TRINITY_DN185_c2_g1_i1.p1 TRINITY_DN185_c2_g1~~TRINITY_DN185_c2_g1_i1.p1  ORF type:complete len:616 (+),score=103.52 TRINITY_DN185_c2_g1_i1:51-1850(+)